jgi:hypothetical protein
VFYKCFGALHLQNGCGIICSTKVTVLCTFICYGVLRIKMLVERN